MDQRLQGIYRDLSKIVRGEVFVDILHRAAYSSDASIYCIVPDCVVVPRDTADIVAVVKYADAEGIPFVARGAGSGVAGESLSTGIVFDMPRFMNRVINICDDGLSVVCEPGVVLDDLNNCLSEYGRKIGPDPSSSNRATIGGCVGNNATGAHWLQYGDISDYVESVEAVLADGSIVELKNGFAPKQGDGDKAASIGRRCLSALSTKEAVITSALPEGRRNRSGYNIADVCRDGKVDLARLMAGSEGTLGIFTKITLRTVPIPPARGLLQLEFDSLEKMAAVIPAIVDSGASACELMDKTLIDMAIEALPQYQDILPGSAAATILVEHTGQTQAEVREKIENTDMAVDAEASGKSIVLDTAEQQRLWKLRKNTVPLLYKKKGRRHPVPFMEDVFVSSDRLGDYIRRLEEIGKRYDVEMAFYGHAGHGELHIRPYLDLSESADVAKMRSIADEVFSLAWSLGGAISGEHADGLVRAAFIKGQYGDEFYQLLQTIKNIFDPNGLMNPGKIMNTDPDVMIKNLRAEHKILPEMLGTDLLFDEDELQLEIEQCSGCGICRSRENSLRMCPVFRALGDELGSSRAKANIIRHWMTGQLQEGDLDWQEFRKFLDLCVNCKACSLECPAGVDISKIICAARAEYVKRKGLRWTEMILGRNRYLSQLGSLFAPVSNFVMSLSVSKWLFEKIAGLDMRRDMPRFKRGTFLKAGRKYLASSRPMENPIDKAAYFVDTYANYNDHELGFAVLDVLRANGIEVILPKQRPVPLPSIVYGDVKNARRDLSFNIKHLAKAVREGYKIICSEPSAALCLKEELRHFVSGEDARLVSENTFELMSYLNDLYRAGKLKPVVSFISRDFAYHLPCHLQAIGGGGASVELLEKLCGIKIAALNAGCCGLAGTFGMQKKNYDLSSKISERLKKALDSSSAQHVLTECAACKMQIEHISDKIVSHPIKIISEAYL